MTKTAIRNILTILVLIIIGMFVAYFYIVGTNEEIDSFEDLKDTFIFGSLISDDVSNGGDSVVIGNDVDGTDKNGVIPKLRKISSSPIAGYVVFQNNDEVDMVRYIEKSTGHVYEASTDSFTQQRVSNTTIPKVQEAVWVDNNSSIIRYFDDQDNIKSFYAEVKISEESSSVDGEIEGVFLQDGIKEIIKLNKQIFYLLTSSAGSVGMISDPDGGNRDQIFNSPLGEWLVQYPQKGTLTFTTKPSAGVNGYMYFFDLNKERMTKVLGGVRGLTTLTNPNKTSTLFSKSYKNSFSLNIYDLVDEVSGQLDLQTLPEKCVWSENNIDVYCGVPTRLSQGDYPDDWYQGLISFSDSVWKMDTEKDYSERIISSEDYSSVGIDLIKPELSINEDYLFFINKKDSSLWSLKL